MLITLAKSFWAIFFLRNLFLYHFEFYLDSFIGNESLQTEYCLPLFQCNYWISVRGYCNISLIYFRACSLFLVTLPELRTLSQLGASWVSSLEKVSNQPFEFNLRKRSHLNRSQFQEFPAPPQLKFKIWGIQKQNKLFIRVRFCTKPIQIWWERRLKKRMKSKRIKWMSYETFQFVSIRFTDDCWMIWNFGVQFKLLWFWRSTTPHSWTCRQPPGWRIAKYPIPLSILLKTLRTSKFTEWASLGYYRDFED